MELCITVPLSPRTPCWRDRTTEGSKASGCFVMRSRNALNSKQTGHCMPSSQDVLPSVSMLTWIGGRKNWLPGSVDCSTNPPSLGTVLPDGRSHIAPCETRARFLTALRKGHRARKRCVSCCCELPCCYQGKGGRFCLREETEMFSQVPLTGTD